MEAPKTDKIVLTTAVEFASVSHKQETNVFLMGTLQAPEFESENSPSRAPIDLVIVVDKSGSMAGEKLALVKETLLFLLTQLKDEDCLAVVTYDTDVTTPIPLCPLNKENRDRITDFVNLLRDGSCTNLCGGLLQGIKEIKGRKQKNEIASILLFTDGLANEGVTVTAQIVNQENALLSSIEAACTVFTFGFGADHDQNMLKAIAENGKGLYYYLKSPDDIPISFADCIGGLMSVVAQNITVKVEPLNGSVCQNYFCKYPSSLEDKHVTVFRMGDLYSEESRSIVLSARLPKLSAPNEAFEAVKFTLSYFNILTSEFNTAEAIAHFNRPAEVPAGQRADFSLDRQRNRVMTGEVMTEARLVGDQGDLPKARSLIQNMIDQINASVSREDPLSKNLLKDLNEIMVTLADKAIYKQEGAKKMMWKQQAHEKERSVGEDAVYENKSKKNAKANFQSSRK